MTLRDFLLAPGRWLERRDAAEREQIASARCDCTRAKKPGERECDICYYHVV